jgi:hypothetical protein
MELGKKNCMSSESQSLWRQHRALYAAHTSPSARCCSAISSEIFLRLTACLALAKEKKKKHFTQCPACPYFIALLRMFIDCHSFKQLPNDYTPYENPIPIELGLFWTQLGAISRP